MRGRERRNVALVHGVTAIEVHAIRHFRRIEVRAARLAVFADVDVLFHNVAFAIDVIAEFTRVMVLVLRDDGIMAGRRRKTFFPCGNGRFADQMFSFIKVSFLLGQMNNDARLAVGAFVIPPTGRWGWHYGREWLLYLLWHFLAAAKQNRDRSHERELNAPAQSHKAADINAQLVRRCNAKH